MKNQKGKSILQIKNRLSVALHASLEKRLNQLGDDVYGIEWFSSYADHVNEQHTLKAA